MNSAKSSLHGRTCEVFGAVTFLANEKRLSDDLTDRRQIASLEGTQYIYFLVFVSYLARIRQIMSVLLL